MQRIVPEGLKLRLDELPTLPVTRIVPAGLSGLVSFLPVMRTVPAGLSGLVSFLPVIRIVPACLKALTW